MLERLKCLLGLHTIDPFGSVYIHPNSERIDVKQKCLCCPKVKYTCLNKNTGEVYKSYII